METSTTTPALQPYNFQLLSEALQELQHQLTPKDVTRLAHLECLHPNTVKNYLRGEIVTPGIGKGILERGRAIVVEKSHAA